MVIQRIWRSGEQSFLPFWLRSVRKCPSMSRLSPHLQVWYHSGTTNLGLGFVGGSSQCSGNFWFCRSTSHLSEGIIVLPGMKHITYLQMKRFLYWYNLPSLLYHIHVEDEEVYAKCRVVLPKKRGVLEVSACPRSSQGTLVSGTTLLWGHYQV